MLKDIPPMADKHCGAPMAVQIICPNLKCRKILSVPEDFRGKQVKCQNCQTVLRVPSGQKQPAKTGN
jgi:LSD1 subclass zinc finger protein